MTDPAAEQQIPDRIRRKWLGRRGGLVIAAIAISLWLYLLLVDDLVLGSIAVVPVALIIGSFTVAGALMYTMAYRIRSDDSVTVRLLLVAFALGGIVSTIAYTPDRVLDLSNGGSLSDPSTAYLLGVGFVEEFLKIVAVILVGWHLKEKTIRGGLFIGGAVGLGFSAFENLGFGVRAWLGGQTQAGGVYELMMNTALREVTGPFAHPLFTAIIAAVIFGASRGGRFRLTWVVLLVFLGVSALHSAWDGVPVLLARLTREPASELGFALESSAVIGVATSLIWVRLSRKSRHSTISRTIDSKAE